LNWLNGGTTKRVNSFISKPHKREMNLDFLSLTRNLYSHIQDIGDSSSSMYKQKHTYFYFIIVNIKLESGPFD